MSVECGPGLQDHLPPPRRDWPRYTERLTNQRNLPAKSGHEAWSVRNERRCETIILNLPWGFQAAATAPAQCVAVTRSGRRWFSSASFQHKAKIGLHHVLDSRFQPACTEQLEQRGMPKRIPRSHQVAAIRSPIDVPDL